MMNMDSQGRLARVACDLEEKCMVGKGIDLIRPSKKWH